MSCAKNFTVKLLDHTIYDCSLIYITWFSSIIYLSAFQLCYIIYYYVFVHTERRWCFPDKPVPRRFPGHIMWRGRNSEVSVHRALLNNMLTMMLTMIKSHVDDRVACYIFSIRIGFLYFQISVNYLVHTYTCSKFDMFQSKQKDKTMWMSILECNKNVSYIHVGKHTHWAIYLQK